MGTRSSIGVSLLTVVVAATLPISTPAQTSATLYGIADAGIGWIDTDAPGDSGTLVVNSGYHSTSRFGLRGSEDLGSGLKATFNLEAGLDIDTGTSDADTGTTFFNRRSVVGLAGSFGEVRLGRDYTAGFMSAVASDAMGYGLLGNWLNFTTQGGITTRANNGIHYTGTFVGLTIRATWAEGETIAPADSGGFDIRGLSAVYAAGPLTAQGYYQQVNDAAGTAIREMGIGGGYEFGGFRLTATYGVADADTGALVRPNLDKLRGLGIGGRMRVGTGQVYAQVIRIDGDAVAGADPETTIVGVAYVHPLSKRTNLYATWGMGRNNATGTFRVQASDNMAVAGAPGADPKALAVGMRHLF